MFLQNNDGNMQDTMSCAAGLDYAGVSPILAHLDEVDACATRLLRMKKSLPHPTCMKKRESFLQLRAPMPLRALCG